MAVDETAWSGFARRLPDRRRGYDKPRSREVPQPSSRLARDRRGRPGPLGHRAPRARTGWPAHRRDSRRGRAERPGDPRRGRAGGAGAALQMLPPTPTPRARRPTHTPPRHAPALMPTRRRPAEKADTYASETRSAADQAAESSAEAEQAARETVEAGEAQAERTIAEGVQRRGEIEALISDLAGNRDKVIAEMEELGGALAGAVGRYKPSPGNDAFETPRSSTRSPGTTTPTAPSRSSSRPSWSMSRLEAPTTRPMISPRPRSWMRARKSRSRGSAAVARRARSKSWAP